MSKVIDSDTRGGSRNSRDEIQGADAHRGALFAVEALVNVDFCVSVDDFKALLVNSLV